MRSTKLKLLVLVDIKMATMIYRGSSLFSLLCCLVLVQSMSSFQFRTFRSTRTLVTTAVRPRMSSNEGSENLDNELVARRIIVSGDVHGGYYRSCVLNEAGRFRRLVGTMSLPDGSDTAEIYVEGKRTMVDGFERWCRRGNVGLSQVTSIKDVIEEEPTGLYEAFYVQTRPED